MREGGERWIWGRGRGEREENGGSENEWGERVGRYGEIVGEKESE